MLQSLAKETVIYGIGSALNRFCALLIFPIYAKSFTLEEFAQQDLVFTTAIVVSLLAGLGMESGYSRLYFDPEKDRSDLATTWGIFALVTSIPLLFVCVFFQDWLAALILKNENAAPVLFWGLLGAAFQMLAKQPYLTLRFNQQPYRFVIVSLFGALSQLIFAVWFVKYLHWGSVGVLRAYAIAGLATLIAGVIASGWIWRGKFCKSFLKEMLAFGLPLLPAAFAAWAFNSLSRYLLMDISGPDETAIYGVAFRIAALLGLLFFGFQMSWTPFAFSWMKKDVKKAATLYADVANWLWLIGGSAVLFISLFSKELIFLLTKEEYLPAFQTIPFLAISALIWAFMYIICLGYQYAKKSYYQLYSMLLGLLFMVILIFLLAPKLGAHAAGIGTLLAYLVAVYFSYRASEKFLKIPYRWKQLLSWAAAILFLSCWLSGYLPWVDFSEFSFNQIYWIGLKFILVILAMVSGFFWLLPQQDRHKAWTTTLAKVRKFIT